MSNISSDEHRWSVLIVSAQKGNESDYRLLLIELGVVISAYLRKRVGQSHFLEDCVQESLIAIHQARHTYDPKRPFKPWLFAIVHHKLVDYLRQKNTNDKYVQRYHQEQEFNVQTQQIETTEQSSDYLFSLLTPPHKEVLMLTKINGLSTKEASAKIGISESAVKVRVHRAINQLKKKLLESK